jgi:hypothetical protein
MPKRRLLMKVGDRARIIDNFTHHMFKWGEIIVIDKVWNTQTFFCHSTHRPNNEWWVSGKEIVAL